MKKRSDFGSNRMVGRGWFWAFLEDWKENVKGPLLPCYNSSEGQPLDRIINSITDEYGDRQNAGRTHNQNTGR